MTLLKSYMGIPSLNNCKENMMDVLTMVIIACLALTAIILIIGVSSMAQGGDFDEKHSDQLMLARVGMQAITLLLLFVALYLANT
jgi:uncharacterized membrane protein YozB (DUF420 family)